MILSYENKVADKLSIREALALSGVQTAPLVSMLKSKKITNPLHNWLFDTMPEASENAHKEVEGIGETPKDTKQKHRNFCQIFKTEVAVSYRKDATEQYTGNELSRQVGMYGKKHIKDIEFALLGLNHANVDADYVDGDGDKTSKMAGFWNFVPAANRVDGGGEEFTYDKLLEIIQPVWEKGGVDDGNFKILLGAKLKRKVNEWIENDKTIRVRDDNKVFNPLITKIETDFGVVDIMLHRLFGNDKLQGRVLCGNFDESSLCYLVDTKLEDVVTDKTAKYKRFYSDVTLEVFNSHYFASGSNFKVD